MFQYSLTLLIFYAAAQIKQGKEIIFQSKQNLTGVLVQLQLPLFYMLIV